MTTAMSRVGYFLVLLGGLALAPPAQSDVATPKGQQQTSSQGSLAEPATTDEFTERLVADLTKSGFQVSEGHPLVYSNDPIETCKDYTYPALQSCLGSNPAAPYVIAVVKSWPNEYVNPTVNMFGPVRPGYSPTYRLDPREAIVIYGKMPPPGRYMGLQTWEWSQQGKWKAKDYNTWANTPNQPFPISLLFSTMPPNDPKSGRVFSFSALGDIINNVVPEKRTAHSEAYLAGDMQNLIDAVCDRASSTVNLQSTDCTQPPPASSFMVDQVRDYGWTGPYCRSWGGRRLSTAVMSGGGGPRPGRPRRRRRLELAMLRVGPTLATPLPSLLRRGRVRSPESFIAKSKEPTTEESTLTRHPWQLPAVSRKGLEGSRPEGGKS